MTLHANRLEGLVRREPTMREIAAEVAARHGLDVDVMLRSRCAILIGAARQEAMATIYATGRFSNQQVAWLFNLSHHSTVIHARRAVARRAGGAQ